jgi:antitoxin component of MazEF toxin-antitoxin module
VGKNKKLTPPSRQREIRKLQSSGKYSKALVLPREFLRKLHWREDQNLAIELDEENRQVIIQDA